MIEFDDITSQTELVRRMREALDVFYVFSNEIIGDRLYIRASARASVGQPRAEDHVMPLELTICRHTLELGAPLIIEDAHTHPLVRRSPALETLGLAAYLGVPVLDNGVPTNRTLSAIHVHRRRWQNAEVDMMQKAARLSLTLPY